MTVHPVYLLTGSNSFGKEEHEKKIVSLASETFGSAETVSHYGSECTADDILNELLSGSLFNSHKIVSIKQAEKLFGKGSGDFKQFVLDYSNRENYPATLILTTDKNKITGLSSLPGDNFETPYENKIPRWIRAQIKEKGKDITTEAATLIVFRCGRNLRAVSSEIEKVLLSYPQLKTIGLEEVKSVAGTYKKGDIFGYLDALLEGNRAKALKILDNLIDFGSEPVRIVAMLKWKLQQMVNSRILMDRGLKERQIIKKLKLRPAFLYRGMCKKMEKYTMDKLVESYDNLKATDIKLKTTSTDAKLLLEKFTLELLTGQ